MATHALVGLGPRLDDRLCVTEQQLEDRAAFLEAAALCLGAHHLDGGWIEAAPESVIAWFDRLEGAFRSLERMRRFRGHFFNWYDLTDLRVLEPAYVSTVDSGNLAGSMIALKQACLVNSRHLDGYPKCLTELPLRFKTAPVARSLPAACRRESSGRSSRAPRRRGAG